MWYKIKNQQVELRIFAKPNAKTTTFLRVDEQGLHIALHAKPQDGKANTVLVAYLAKLLQLPKSQVILQCGKESRHKKIIVPWTVTIQKLLDDPESFYE